jgi:putative membrane protein
MPQGNSNQLNRPIMKIFTNLAASIVLLSSSLLMSSCSNVTTYEEAMELNRKKIDDAERLNDAQFLVEIKSLNMFQLELLKLANKNGYSSEIVNLGKDNIGPFTTMDSDLTNVAKKEKFRLPTEMSEDHQARLQRLTKTQRQEIDQRIIEEIKISNDQTLQKFTAQATEAFDPDIRAFAARKIGALRAHNINIKKVEEGLLTTVKDETNDH